jgi:hypothetical protein
MVEAAVMKARAPVQPMDPTWVQARAGRVAAIDAVAAALAAAALVLLRLVPQVLSPLAFGLLLALSVAGFGADFARWLIRGVRAVGIDGDALVLLEGRRRRRIGREEVSEVTVLRRWGGRRIELALAGGRRRVVISDDGYSRADFERLSSLLAAWR